MDRVTTVGAVGIFCATVAAGLPLALDLAERIAAPVVVNPSPSPSVLYRYRPAPPPSRPVRPPAGRDVRRPAPPSPWGR